ncbi:TetR/AcrR family transcriptional regulator [Nakamurella silvestris]|nr:TetR/AcrR family transcriptional regulator [Nakamurella silvestris]
MPDHTPRRRADAAENRRLILAAALDALNESSEASLNSIAARAGVANATLYRHFPTRESLVLEVYRFEVEQLVVGADEFLGSLDPAEALRAWVQRLAQYAMTKHGLAPVLRTATGPGTALFTQTYDQIVGALARLLDAAADSGAVRDGLNPDTVVLALAGLWEIDPNSDWRSTAAELYELVLLGLRR